LIIDPIQRKILFQTEIRGSQAPVQRTTVYQLSNPVDTSLSRRLELPKFVFNELCACEGHKTSFRTTISSLDAAGKKLVNRKFRKHAVRMGDFENW
jgi:hypothetical protein